MIVVADQNIPQVEEAFASLGEVRLVEGRSLSPEAIRDADVLLVRSVTRVGEALLAGSKVRFVGTATIGTDHLDQDFLRDAGIAWTSAAGSNANSVAEYVIAAILTVAGRRNRDLADKTLGIVGQGNIGSRLARLAPALGMRVLANDPPLERSKVPGNWMNLPELLADADFVTCHVPLIRSGQDKTVHLIGPRELAQMKPEAVLVNTSRGPVVDNSALLESLDKGQIGGAVLDVWEGEPDIRCDLLERVDLGTPHIAGYSIDGKLNGTVLMLRAVCRDLGRLPEWAPSLPLPEEPEIRLGDAPRQEALCKAVHHAYPITRDDLSLRMGLSLARSEWPAYFDGLRKNYPVRLEFPHYRVSGRKQEAGTLEALRVLGFGGGSE